MPIFREVTARDVPAPAFGLGDFIADSAEIFDVSLPTPVIDQLNTKLHMNEEDQLVFNFPKASGFLAPDQGEISWNDGKTKYNYNVFSASEDGLEGGFSSQLEGQVDEFLKDFFGTYNWQTVSESFGVNWSIDPVELEASFSYSACQVVTAKPNIGDVFLGDIEVPDLEHTFTYFGEIAAKVEASSDSFELEINPKHSIFGWNDAPEEFESYHGWFENADHNYNGTIVVSVPELDECDAYFSPAFDATSQCVVNFVSSDLGTEPVQLKFKHKFAYAKFGNFMAYVKSENFDGSMTGFDEAPYLSFYFTENAAGKAFKTIKKNYSKVQDTLYLTIPFAAADEVYEALEEFVFKFAPAAEYLISNPVKSVYWIDSFVASVKPTTFDLSDVIYKSRFAVIGIPNGQIFASAKFFARAVSNDLENVDFAWLQEFRDFVVEVQAAEGEVATNLVMPQ